MIVLCPVDATGWTDIEIANSIFWSEGGRQAQYAYGIRSVKYSSWREAREICLRTIRNNKKRYLKYGYKTHKDFISFLASRYAPLSAHKINRNWKKNVLFYLGKRRQPKT